MSLTELYNSLPKISYKNYVIDDIKNLLLLKELEKLNLFLKKTNINFLITGSIASFLYYKKIYRTFKDIDIVVNSKNLTLILYLLRNDFRLYSRYSVNETLSNFFSIKTNATITLESKITNYNLDLINYDHLVNNYSIDYQKIFIKNCNENLFYYIKPLKMVTWMNREKDIDDANFYKLCV